MHLKEGKYQPGTHIAQELLKFSDENLSKKEVQQFLGIVNYLRDFIPKISKHTNPLRKMLKKDAPPWKEIQTKAVKNLKELLQHLPPLQIPSDGKRILQTDASDKYWGAVLFEEKEGKRHLCGFKSGRFTNAKKHYHSTFKEILAVKKGITKFEFHLIGHHFLVEMDMSSFPQMLKFKQKIVPHPQLLRWSEWFSKYSFDTKHIKGKTNVLADFLTRPTKEIMMFNKPSSSKPPPAKKSKTLPSAFDIPPNLNQEYPPEVFTLCLENKFHQKTKGMIFQYQLNLFRDFGGLILKPYGLHPEYPFIHPLHFEFTEFPNELKWFLWYLTHLYHIGIHFSVPDLQYFLAKAVHDDVGPEMENFFVFLKWFYPLDQWLEMINKEVLRNPGLWMIIIFYKPRYFLQHGKATQLGSFPSAWVYRT